MSQQPHGQQAALKVARWIRGSGYRRGTGWTGPQVFALAQKTERLDDDQLAGEARFYVEALGTALEQARAALAREISVSTAEGS